MTQIYKYASQPIKDYISTLKHDNPEEVEKLFILHEFDVNGHINEHNYAPLDLPDDTFLILAVEHNCINTVKYLLERGAAVSQLIHAGNAGNADNTALGRAVLCLREKIVDVLLASNETAPNFYTEKSSNLLSLLQDIYTGKSSVNSINCRNSGADSYYDRTDPTLVSIAKKLVARGANTDLLSDPEFLQKIDEPAITPATSQESIKDLTTLSPAGARDLLAGNNTLNIQKSNLNITESCGGYLRQNFTSSNGTLGENNSPIFSPECIDLNPLVGSINSAGWGWGTVLGVSAGIVVVTGVLGSVAYYVKNRYQQRENYQKSAV